MKQAHDQRSLSTTSGSIPCSSSSASSTTNSTCSVLTSSGPDSVVNETDANFVESEALTIPSRPPTSTQVFNTRHTEFGHCDNPAYRYKSQQPPDIPFVQNPDLEPPYYILFTTYISFIIVIFLGHLADFLGKRFHASEFMHLAPHDGYAPLTSDFDSFYTRRLKKRLDECFSQPVTGVAGRTIVILNRISTNWNATQQPTGQRTRALNISSYNYLGFAQAQGGCADAVETCIKNVGVSGPGSLRDCTTDVHTAAEALVARFLGTEDGLICSMGFATNSTILPALVGRGCLVISDERNHASIRAGVRLSGASVRMFKHNDMEDLEAVLREVISQGQPRHHRPWKKILLVVEGLYSMEGTMVDLPSIMVLKRRYKFYLYVDEAHSIGALGPHGRGVTDFFTINPRQVDVLMGTFTKSFGAAGGYIAGQKTIVERLRLRGHAGTYAEAMTPPVLTQVMVSMAGIMGMEGVQALEELPASASVVPATDLAVDVHNSPHYGRMPSGSLPGWLQLPPELASGAEGAARLQRLSFNSRYLSLGLKKLGFITFGHASSPITPLIVYNPGKMVQFHRMMLDYRERIPDPKCRRVPILTVVVSYPATPLVTCRVRFCVSASHTKEDIDLVLRACDEIGDYLDLKHGIPCTHRWTIDQVVDRAVELVHSPEC
ncbi:serine palmitoyltransferase 2 [Fistulina hepatica ATCC 64428]|uniref:serine C-palmitoyltransferase n=1 Tax=Fistulina hepatica ATCC 64428 TaxID=1128425 RepID=A0A0D7A2E0_9AGAR|nr:serine palmitoyltransferase 2 [Fistulina hepatica ATCC 64428]